MLSIHLREVKTVKKNSWRNEKVFADDSLRVNCAVFFLGRKGLKVVGS
jgi:hypothetical protein